jgi:ADP-ribose pyrophosphatase
MKILKVEKITNEKWLNLYAASYEHKGRKGRWIYASRRDSRQQGVAVDAVIIVPILHAKGKPPRLVLVKEFRVPIGGYNYGLPAGLLEPGEGVEETVRREMREETGMEVVRVKRISPPLCSSTGMTDEATVMVFVDVRSTPETKQALEGSEDIEVLLLDYEQVSRLCDSPDLPLDAKAWNVLYLYQQLGRLA